VCLVECAARGGGAFPERSLLAEAALSLLESGPFDDDPHWARIAKSDALTASIEPSDSIDQHATRLWVDNQMG